MKIIDYNYQFSDKGMFRNKSAYKNKTPYKGPHGIIKIWNNGKLTLQMAKHTLK